MACRTMKKWKAAVKVIIILRILTATGRKSISADYTTFASSKDTATALSVQTMTLPALNL